MSSQASPIFRGFLRRFASSVGEAGVHAKMMGIVLALVLLFGLSVTLQMRAVLTRTMSDRLREQGRTISTHLAARGADLILTNNVFALHEMLRDTLYHNEDVRYVFFVGPDGEVIAHSFGQQFPDGLLQANSAKADLETNVEILKSEEGLIWDFATSVFEGRAGAVRLGISERRLGETVASLTTLLLLITSLVSLVGMSAAFWLTRIVTHPLSEIVQATQSVARGNLDVKAPAGGKDEISNLGAAFNRMVADLARAREIVEQKERLRAQLLQKVITAQEEERKRIARELHDQTGQFLTSLLVGLKFLEGAEEPEARNAQTAYLKEQVGSALENVRAMARELRPSVLDDLGLVPALERYLQDYSQRLKLKTDFQTLGLNGRLPHQVEIELYRIIQEAMTNVARHAGASSANVLLEQREGQVVAIIEDDGRGFSVEQFLGAAEKDRYLGLFGMQERAALLGGEVSFESAPNKGTTVFVEIPLEEGHGQIL